MAGRVQVNVGLPTEVHAGLAPLLERAKAVLGLPNLTVNELVTASLHVYGLYLAQVEKRREEDLAAVVAPPAEMVPAGKGGRPRTTLEPDESEPKKPRGRPRKKAGASEG